MPQKYIDIGDVATLVHHRGPTTLPGAPPTSDVGTTIICLHDGGSCGRQFDDLMDELASDHSPIAFDQPGHGRSGSLDALDSVSAMANHVSAIAKAWAIDQPVLVGEGLGAAVALELAARAPGWATGIVAIGGAAASFDLGDEIEQLSAVTAGRARRDFDRTGYAPDTDRAVYQKAFANWVTTDPRATLGARKAQAAWSLDDIGQTATLVVVGEHEEAASGDAARSLADGLANGQVVELAGAGRRGVLEQPARLASVVADFIQGLEVRGFEVQGLDGGGAS